MEFLFTTKEIKEVDRLTITEFGIPSFTLMESASRVVADIIEKRVEGKRVSILCGKGNNGGDGLALARTLFNRGFKIDLYILSEEFKTPESQQNYELIKKLQNHNLDNRLKVNILDKQISFEKNLFVDLLQSDCVVDALVGVGLEGEISYELNVLVNLINKSKVSSLSTPTPLKGGSQRGSKGPLSGDLGVFRCAPLIVAIDIPTGLNSDTGQVRGEAIKADITITMGAAKLGLHIGQGKEYSGEIYIAEIGIPQSIIKRIAEENKSSFQVSRDDVRQWLPVRAHETHKYEVGLALIIAGSKGLSGAAEMSSKAAARIGAGAVICACPEGLQNILANKFTEIMSLGLPETADGHLSLEALDDKNLEIKLAKAKAILIGCGLGRNQETQQFVRTFLEKYANKPFVIDADGLNALIDNTDIISKHSQGNWILTPHLAEFVRLIAGTEKEKTENEKFEQEKIDWPKRIKLVRKYASKWNCFILLKGLPSILGFPDGQIFVNSTGNNALATAGTGDVLAGFCVGLLAQGLETSKAAMSALHLGGLCADQYVKKQKEKNNPINSMLASDLINELSQLKF